MGAGGSTGHPQHHPWWQGMDSAAGPGRHPAQRGGRSFQNVPRPALAMEPGQPGMGRVQQSSLWGRTGSVPVGGRALSPSAAVTHPPHEAPFAQCQCRCLSRASLPPGRFGTPPCHTGPGGVTIPAGSRRDTGTLG